MRPAVVVLGFVLGSAAAITFALAGTVIVFTVLRDEYPRLDAEMVPLLVSTGLFVLLTAAAGASFYGELRARGWRRAAHAVLAVMLTVVAVYYAWPRLKGSTFALSADPFPRRGAVEGARVVGVEPVVAGLVEGQARVVEHVERVALGLCPAALDGLGGGARLVDRGRRLRNGGRRSRASAEIGEVEQSRIRVPAEPTFQALEEHC